MTGKIKAVCLFSGGLDSVLAAKIVQNENIDVFALMISTPFYGRSKTAICSAEKSAQYLNIPLKVISADKEYLKIIRNPKHGHGRGANPCIDCRLYMLKKAKKYAKQIKAKFIFTGEVLGQRPMTQHMRAIKIIEKEAGLENKIVRPLSAGCMPRTEAEKNGWINKGNLFSITGRSRKLQMSLAKKFKIDDFQSPGGGCLLTCKEFANKVSDLFTHKKRITEKDIGLLKTGRHFRSGRNKIIVGIDEPGNRQLLNLKNKTDYIFEVPGCGSPTTILQGKKTRDAIKTAASLTARYSDAKTPKVKVLYGKEKPNRQITVTPATQNQIDKLRV